MGVNAKTKKTRKGNEITKYSIQKEWKVDSLDEVEAGGEVTLDAIPEEGTVTVTGVSKGKGFQGVIKRHGFHRGPQTHGSHHHRRPGSIGMKVYPGRVIKGKKLPGQTGKETVTIRNRPVVTTDKERGVVGIKGAVPGPNGAHVFLTLDSDS